MKGLKQRTAAVLIVAMTCLQVMPAAADETTTKKNEWELTEDGWVYWNSKGKMKKDAIVHTGDGQGGKAYYYLDENGIMVSEDWVTVGDFEDFEEGTTEIYYALPGGELAEFQWVYLDDDGRMVRGNSGGDWYHFDSNRRMEAGVRNKISKVQYCFDEDGKMLTQGWVEFDEENHPVGYDEVPDFEMEDGKERRWRYYEFDGQEAQDKRLNLNGDWYEFNSKGIAREASPAEAEELPGTVTDVVLKGEEIERSVTVGDTLKVKFKAILEPSELEMDSDAEEASPGEATPGEMSENMISGVSGEPDGEENAALELTGDHDFWHLAEFDFDMANSFKVKRSWDADGTITLAYTPYYPGTITLQAVVDGEESEKVTITSDWGENPEKAILETMNTVFEDSANTETATSINHTVEALVYLCSEMEDAEALMDELESRSSDIEGLEADYVFAANISQSNEVSEDAGDLLTDGTSEIVGGTLNAENGSEVVFQIAVGDDVELEDEYEAQVSLDLSLNIDGSERSELDVPVMIRIPLPEGISAENLKLYHEHDGEVKELEYTVSGNTITFMTDGFSNFIFAGDAEEVQENDPGDNSGSDSENNSGNGSGSSSGRGSGRSERSRTSIPETPGTWEEREDGRWQFVNAGGSFYHGTWIYVKDHWYWIDADGMMAEGWREIGEKRYYLAPANGAMVTGWHFDGQNWYYFNQDGVMQNGWVLTNGKWYYLGTDGRMLADTVTPDGYQVDTDGAWVQ